MNYFVTSTYIYIYIYTIDYNIQSEIGVINPPTLAIEQGPHIPLFLADPTDSDKLTSYDPCDPSNTNMAVKNQHKSAKNPITSHKIHISTPMKSI